MFKFEMEVEGRGLGIRQMNVVSKVIFYGEMGKDFCPNLIPTFLECIKRGTRNDVSQKRFPSSAPANSSTLIS